MTKIVLSSVMSVVMVNLLLCFNDLSYDSICCFYVAFKQ